MKIGIDARLYSQTGIGRYIRNVLKVLEKIDQKNQYVVYLTKEDQSKFIPQNKNWVKKIINVHWHSFLEQLLLPIYLYKDKLDLVHFPYFNVPVFYLKPFIVTIHDLTHLHFDTGRASTLPNFFYQIKRIGLKITLWHAIKHSKKIIAVSEATKKEIIDHYKISPEKIVVTYEGIENLDSEIGDQRSEITCKFSRIYSASRDQGPYLLYVGNAYPHKNLERLIRVMGEIGETKLVLVGPNDFFYQRLKGFVKKLNLTDKIIFFGAANDFDLINLYRKAKCFILPSLMEGFGLVGLEAMKEGCPVLASNIPSLREIYNDSALYFNPNQVEEIKEAIKKIISDQRLRDELIKKGQQRLSAFSWQKMAEQTREIYSLEQ